MLAWPSVVPLRAIDLHHMQHPCTRQSKENPRCKFSEWPLLPVGGVVPHAHPRVHPYVHVEGPGGANVEDHPLQCADGRSDTRAIQNHEGKRASARGVDGYWALMASWTSRAFHMWLAHPISCRFSDSFALCVCNGSLGRGVSRHGSAQLVLSAQTQCPSQSRVKCCLNVCAACQAIG